MPTTLTAYSAHEGFIPAPARPYVYRSVDPAQRSNTPLRRCTDGARTVRATAEPLEAFQVPTPYATITFRLFR